LRGLTRAFCSRFEQRESLDLCYNCVVRKAKTALLV
jgi:hypothetical protein